MTLMLASVADAAEAEMAAGLGADIVDLKDPRAGALGAVSVETARSAVAAAAGTETSATLGDPPYDVRALAERAEALIAAGVDYLKIAVDLDSLNHLEPALERFTDRTKLVGLMFADKSPDFALLGRLAEGGFKGAMLDTSDKSKGRLLVHLGIAQLADFCARCRASGLLAGLAGSLEAPDIPRLRLIEPDVLGFRGALCQAHDRRAEIDPKAVALIRDLIPRVRRPSDSSSKVNWLVLARGLVGGREREVDVESVYVRDFLISADIGAYDAERNAPQRVVFDVEASVHRLSDGPDDLRSIFSYDVILDAIRLVVGRGHTDFVETLAGEVAEIVLRDPRVRGVRVNVRKLDVVSGAVGIEIRRERDSRAMDRSAPEQYSTKRSQVVIASDAKQSRGT